MKKMAFVELKIRKEYEEFYLKNRRAIGKRVRSVCDKNENVSLIFGVTKKNRVVIQISVSFECHYSDIVRNIKTKTTTEIKRIMGIQRNERIRFWKTGYSVRPLPTDQIPIFC